MGGREEDMPSSMILNDNADNQRDIESLEQADNTC